MTFEVSANTDLMHQMIMLFLGGLTLVVIIVEGVIALVRAAVPALKRRRDTDARI